MMDDRFLHEHRQAPRPAFGRALRERLRGIEADEAPRVFRPAPLLAVAAALAVVSLFAFPAVRASAQAFLELFRVRQFAAVRFDPAQLERLEKLQQGNNALLVFDDHEVLRDPGPRRTYASLEEAAAVAGLAPRKLTFLPQGLKPDSVFLEGEAEGRFTLHSAKLRTLLDQIGLNDVPVPTSFDGRPVHVKKPSVVHQQYRGSRSRARLVQSRSPEVGFPPGADLAQLGEVGLRILGLDPAEARRMAQTIDWRSTLVVPVPLNASTFRPVTIHGNDGLLVSCTGKPNASGDRPSEGHIVMWSEGERLFAVFTNLSGPDAVIMAESVQ